MNAPFSFSCFANRSSITSIRRRGQWAIGICSFISSFFAFGLQAQPSLAYTQQKRVPSQPIFQIKNPDYKTSPFTGMTRRHWKDAALYLLNGAFSYIDKLDDPMQFPKEPGKSYPRNAGMVPTEKLEGLCRTLFLAVPLLKEDSNLICHGIRVADYYRYHIGNLSDSLKEEYIRARARNGGPSQILVEFGGLGLSLSAIPEILFDPLPKEKQDALATLMLSYGDGPTIGNNWKFFNIFVLSFFKSKGYPVNEALLLDLLNKTLAHYRGDGWYNDAPAYDYYSMWAFQMYGTFWSNYFGDKYYPQLAAQFRANFAPLKDNYPYLFSRAGEMILWGRSMSYRTGAIVPFPLMGLSNDTKTNYGWMRRIASGVVLQFLKNPDFLQDNIPTLGFYGPFEPTVQPYSCRGSVFWLAKGFLGLLVPEDNPFWKTPENEGAWATELKKGTVFSKLEDSSHILITDYPNIGASELRAWCKAKAIGASEPFRSSENYNRLSYNSAFPWQADSIDGVVAMNYLIRNRRGEWEPLRLYDYKKWEGGSYYREAVLETNPAIKLQLADRPLPNGILRVDKVSSDTATEIRLGHYALPQLKTPIKTTTRTVGRYTATIIDNGTYQLAMVPIQGWSKSIVCPTIGVHPQAVKSAVINVRDSLSPGEEKVYITLMLWKRSGEKWTADELMPVGAATMSPEKRSVDLSFRNATTSSSSILNCTVTW